MNGRLVSRHATRHRRFRRSARCCCSGVLALGGLAATALIGGSTEQLVTSMMIDAIIVIGLQVYIGNTGVLSFGHIGFGAIAGYTFAVLAISPEEKVKRDSRRAVESRRGAPLTARCHVRRCVGDVGGGLRDRLRTRTLRRPVGVCRRHGDHPGVAVRHARVGGQLDRPHRRRPGRAVVRRRRHARLAGPDLRRAGGLDPGRPLVLRQPQQDGSPTPPARTTWQRGRSASTRRSSR